MPFKNKNILYRLGLVLFLISSTLFIVNDLSFNNSGGAFFANFGIAILFWIALMMYRTTKAKFSKIFSPTGKDQIAFGLVFMTSCFSLNREIEIFEPSADWLTYYLILMYVSLWPILIFNNIPKLIKKAIHVAIGLTIPLLAYYSFYLLPFTGIGLIGTIALGIGFHVFVPFILLLGCVRYLVSEYKEDVAYLRYSLISAALPVLISITTIVMWNIESNKIEKLSDKTSYENITIPKWVYIAQHLSYDLFEDTYLKQDILYPIHNFFNDFGFGMPRNNFSENQLHNPLVVLGQLFSRPSNLSQDDRLKLLLLNPENRHQSEVKLWRGDYLKTDHIKTTVELIPEYRLAYTEKEIWIKNKSLPKTWRGNNQEALYTFQLPEGGIVTSLSLWINGIEEKSYLTTKSKADSAYTQIVGGEARDPSLVHWKEGNQITVRVFPCTRDEIRHYKLGITTPLELDGKKLNYKAISFEGPSANTATEEFIIISDKTIESDDLKLNHTGNKWIGETSFNNHWSLSTPSTPISSSPFIFNGKKITTSLYTESLSPIQMDNIYLDLNNNWTTSEVHSVIRNAKTSKVIAFLYDEEYTLEEDNYLNILSQFDDIHFSLFPFHKVEDKSSALIISKSDNPGVQYGDIKESRFIENIKSSFLQNPKHCLFSIGKLKSQYLNCLKDVAAFDYQEGSITELEKVLTNQKFPISTDGSSSVSLKAAGMTLHMEQTEEGNSSNVTDHLMRIFNFRQIMLTGPEALFNNEDFINPENMALAKEAYVVSPVSSMIVLETQEDYERFGIEKSDNSLENAIISSKGAAPEPHEWCMIILLILFSGYYISKNHKSWSWS